ncbi:MAG: hypothetical protein KatS3mg019_0924 [Fimbriimonadales bacterium]|nr:MAG: hypothetical protein KatS3mg019_0924 [Fimbriimonadales bacterium]
MIIATRLPPYDGCPLPEIVEMELSFTSAWVLDGRRPRIRFVFRFAP